MCSNVTLRVCLQLLDTNAVGVRREKMYKLDGHVACAVAGITGRLVPCLATSRAIVMRQSHSVSCSLQLMLTSS